MHHSAYPPTVRASVFATSMVTTGSTVLTAIFTWITVRALHTEGAFTWLSFLPCLIAAGCLGLLLARGAEKRAHFALAITAALLAVATAVVYVPAWSGGTCMGGLALLTFIPLSLGFPVVFLTCWLLGRP